MPMIVRCRFRIKPIQFGMQADDATDNDQCRRLQLRLCGLCRQGVQRTGYHFLVERGALLHDGGRRGTRHTVFLHLVAQSDQAFQTHVDDDGLARAAEHVPIQIHRAVLEMAGDQNQGLSVITMRQRNASIGGDSSGGGDSWHDLERNSMLAQRFNLFATSPKDERVAAL